MNNGHGNLDDADAGGVAEDGRDVVLDLEGKDRQAIHDTLLRVLGKME